MTTPKDDLALFATPSSSPQDRGTRDAAEVAADAGWVEACLSAIQQKARTGRVFQAHDIAREFEIGEPAHPNMWGRTFQLAYRLDIIAKVSPVPSSRRTTCGSLTWTWRGTPDWVTGAGIPEAG